MRIGAQGGKILARSLGECARSPPKHWCSQTLDLVEAWLMLWIEEKELNQDISRLTPGQVGQDRNQLVASGMLLLGLNQ